MLASVVHLFKCFKAQPDRQELPEPEPEAPAIDLPDLDGILQDKVQELLKSEVDGVVKPRTFWLDSIDVELDIASPKGQEEVESTLSQSDSKRDVDSPKSKRSFRSPSLRKRQKSSTPSSPASRPALDGSAPSVANFAGRWVLNRIEGDVDAFMAEAGSGWAVRRLAKTMNYGIGSSEQTVTVTDTDITIVNKVGPRENVTTLPLSGEEVVVKGLDGTSCITTGVWNESFLLVETMKLDRTPQSSTKRYFEGEEVVIEASTMTGLKVRRIYKCV